MAFFKQRAQTGITRSIRLPVELYLLPLRVLVMRLQHVLPRSLNTSTQSAMPSASPWRALPSLRIVVPVQIPTIRAKYTWRDQMAIPMAVRGGTTESQGYDSSMFHSDPERRAKDTIGRAARLSRHVDERLSAMQRSVEWQVMRLKGSQSGHRRLTPQAVWMAYQGFDCARKKAPSSAASLPWGG